MIGLNENLPLPSLNPMLKLYKGLDKADGTPTWTLHHPVSNKYFQIGWAEFECLARFHRYNDTDSLIEAVNKETTVKIDRDDVKSLIIFLHNNALVAGSDSLAQPPEIKKQSLWLKILHHYLFFTLPLFRPQGFLNKSHNYVRPFLSRPFLTFSYGLLIVMLLLTMQRADEFLHTFFQLFSAEGAIMIAVLFMGVKIFHELGHAYTATKYNVPIPHMGVAFIVLYPILYTETTGAWRLESRRARIHIGLAGIATELVIAAYALLLWNILPPGPLQSMAFGVVAISLIGSLLVNLNPLMRFDGYYVLSDALGIENLHSRAIAFARWRLRKLLFNLDDPVPEEGVSEDRQGFLIWLGFAVMIYRFFLFLGIALLVYYMFFQPLGLILMIVELAWFIGLPIWKEVLIWGERSHEIMRRPRAIVNASVLIAILVFTALPVQSTVTIPAVMHAAKHRSVYSPVPAYIKEINFKDGDRFSTGDVLARLESAPLKRDLTLATLQLENLKSIKRREQTDSELYRERRGALEDEIKAAQENLESLKRQEEQLIITAEFDGMIRDLSPEIHPGRNVNPGQLLFQTVKTDEIKVTGYLNEDQLARVKKGNTGVFHPDYSLTQGQNVKISEISDVNVQTLDWKELSSVYSGPIASEFFSENQGAQGIFPRQSLYKVEFTTAQSAEKTIKKQWLIEKGQVKLEAEHASMAHTFFKRLSGLIVRESGLN